MKKIFCLVLAILMLSAVLVSCKKPNEQEGSQGTVTTPVSTDPNRVAPEVKDFGGYEFKFILNNDSGNEGFEVQAPLELTGEGVNDTIYSRNKMVEGLYNIKIVDRMNLHPTSDESFSYLSNAALSGDYYADVYGALCSRLTQRLAPQGFFYNVYDLQSLRLDSEWWDQDFLDEMTINGYAYSLTGDIQPNDDLRQNAIALNLSLYEETYPEKNIHEIVVTNGAWTMDEFYKTWNEFGSFDGGQTGMMDEGDLVGFLYDSRTANYMYMASGLKAFSMQNGQPVLLISSDKALKVVDWLQKIVDGQSGLKSARVESAGGYELGSSHFAAGQILMSVNQFIGSLSTQLNMEDDVVYPPFPKYDDTQDRYYSVVHKDFSPIAISANVTDKERTALILEVLAFYSEKLQSEVMDILIQERLTSEIEPREILQMTLNSKTYDLEYMGDIMGWTTRVNKMIQENQLSNYAAEMKSIESNAITTRGNGKLQLFLRNYAKIK